MRILIQMFSQEENCTIPIWNIFSKMSSKKTETLLK